MLAPKPNDALQQTSASTVMFLALVLALSSPIALTASVQTAEAQQSGGGSHGGGSHSGGSGGGSSSGADDHSHDDSGDDHSHDDTSHSGGSKGKQGSGGQGGKKSGGHGGSASLAAPSSNRGNRNDRPPWASGGIPEIELGRLNVARSPSHVLDRAYQEALANFTADKVAFYNLSIPEAAATLQADFRNLSLIDSPLQNLALLRDVFEDGNSVLNTLDQIQNDNGTLAAIFLGTASDKAIPIKPETVYSLGVILGYELSEAQATQLATNAEVIRTAIAAGHG